MSECVSWRAISAVTTFRGQFYGVEITLKFQKEKTQHTQLMTDEKREIRSDNRVYCHLDHVSGVSSVFDPCNPYDHQQFQSVRA